MTHAYRDHDHYDRLQDARAEQGPDMTRDEINKALRDPDIRACGDVYPIRKRTAERRVSRPDARRQAWENPRPPARHDDTGFAPDCVI